ncbi:replication initiator protein A [Granulicatella balaenopterae]
MTKTRQQFYQVPKLIVAGERYKNLSALDIMTYAVMLDRQQVSIKNHWHDEKGEVYFLYSNNHLAETMGVSVPTVVNVKRNLMEVGLLRVVQTGRYSMLYLSAPVPETDEEEKYLLEDKEEDTETENVAENKKVEAIENPVVIAPKKVDAPVQKSPTSDSLMEKCFNLVEKNKQLNTKETQSQDERNLNPDFKKFNTSKTYFNNNKPAILNNNKKSYDSSDEQMSFSTFSVKNSFPENKKNGQTEVVSEQSRNFITTPKKVVHHFHDIDSLGLPDKIITLLETFSKDEDDLQNILSLIFKAKSNVCRRNPSMLRMEELTEFDFIKLHQVLYVALHKRKCDPTLRNFEAYLMRSLINFFEENATLHYEVNGYIPPIYAHVVEEVAQEEDDELKVPLINWV